MDRFSWSAEGSRLERGHQPLQWREARGSSAAVFTTSDEDREPSTRPSRNAKGQWLRTRWLTRPCAAQSLALGHRDHGQFDVEFFTDNHYIGAIPRGTPLGSKRKHDASRHLDQSVVETLIALRGPLARERGDRLLAPQPDLRRTDCPRREESARELASCTAWNPGKPRGHNPSRRRRSRRCHGRAMDACGTCMPSTSLQAR